MLSRRGGRPPPRHARSTYARSHTHLLSYLLAMAIPPPKYRRETSRQKSGTTDMPQLCRRAKRFCLHAAAARRASPTCRRCPSLLTSQEATSSVVASRSVASHSPLTAASPSLSPPFSTPARDTFRDCGGRGGCSERRGCRLSKSAMSASKSVAFNPRLLAALLPDAFPFFPPPPLPPPPPRACLSSR